MDVCLLLIVIGAAFLVGLIIGLRWGVYDSRFEELRKARGGLSEKTTCR